MNPVNILFKSCLRNLQLFLYITFFIAAFFMLTLLSNHFPRYKLVLLENNTPPLIMTDHSKYAKEWKLMKLKMIFSFFSFLQFGVIETEIKQCLAFLAVGHVHSQSHAWNAIIDICENIFSFFSYFFSIFGFAYMCLA